jgi:RHS repeat-associated protein
MQLIAYPSWQYSNLSDFTATTSAYTIPSDAVYVELYAGIYQVGFTTSTPHPTFIIPNAVDIQKGNYGPVRFMGRKSDFVADPVNAVTGSFYTSHTDIRVNAPLPIEIRRNYSSSNSSRGEFGYGWTSNLTPYLVLADDLSTIQASTEDGSVLTFTKETGLDIWDVLPADNPDASNLGGGLNNVFTEHITKETDGGNTFYIWKRADGSIQTYQVESFPLGDFTRERPYIVTKTDRNGNTLTYTFGATSTANDYGLINNIASSNGAYVTLTYNPEGLLSQALASDGRSVSYSYVSEDLMHVELPDDSNYYYAYKLVSGISVHLLARETKPGGRILLNYYDGSNRVYRQMATVDVTQPTVPVVNATFDYSVANQTTIKDAYNNPTVYHYTGSLITSIVDPLTHTTSKTWYAATNTATGAYINSVESETDARGLVTHYKYDAQGNVIETKLTGDLDGDPATTTETATTTAYYNSLNLPEWITNASGITTTFTYGDTNYPYLPTQIVTTKGTSTLRTDKLDYTLRTATVGSVTTFAKGLFLRKTVAFGSSDQAITEYDYDSTGFCLSETRYTGTADPSVVTTFAPTARREILTATDGDGRSTTFTYDGMSRPLTRTIKDETGAAIGASATSYTGNGEPYVTTGMRTGPADTVTRDYDTMGRPQQKVVTRSEAKTDGSGVQASASATTGYIHDLFGNLITETDPRGNTTVYTPDAIGQLLYKKTYAGTTTTGTPSRSEGYTYEPGGKVQTYTNPLGGVTTTYYTYTGKPRRQENPDGSVLQWRYLTDGRLQKEILRNGSYWLTTYDDIAHTITRTLTKTDNVTVLATETSAYDLRGNLISRTDPESYTKAFTYDGLNRVKIATGPAAAVGSAQQVVTNTYGASAKTLTTQNALGEKSVTVSDALGRPFTVDVKDNQGTVVRHIGYAYSTDHQAVTVTSGTGTGAITRTIYTDLSGKPLLEIDGLAKFTRHTYDLNGNRLTTTDPLVHTTEWTYNELNQVATQILPDTNLTTFTHDAAGHLTLREMAGGLNAEELFDNAGRIISSRLYSGSTVSRQFAYAYYPNTSVWAGLLQMTTAPRQTMTTTYDDFLRPYTVTTAGTAAETNGTTTYGYDRRNLVTSVAQSSTANAAGPATTISRGYDGYGQLLTEALTVGGSAHSSVTQTWDAAGRRASVNEAGSTLSSPLFSYRYRADGLLSEVITQNYRIPNLNYFYGDNGLLTSKNNLFRTQTVNTRDGAGRITQETTAVGGANSMVENQTWRDDGTLDSYAVTHTGAGAWNESRSYGYDTRGQVTSEGFSPSPAASSALAYVFDNNTAGLGVRTDAKVGSGAPSAWQSSATTINSLSRVTADQTNALGRDIPANGISRGANYVELFVDGSSKGKATYPGWADSVGAWSKTLTLDAGVHTLTANAVHPSGHFTAMANATFTVNVPLVTLTSGYDADGNVTSRTWSNGTAQTLTWDAFNRLIKVSQRDGSNNGYDWTAVYDGLGRRLKTTQQVIAANTASGSPTATTSIYDPQVEFLEIGVAVNGVKAWKAYGNDLNGRFGGLQGTGGLEATILDADGTPKGVLSDSFGNGVASVTGSTVTWFPSRSGAYGPLPNIRAEVLTDVTRVAEATAWRSRRIDPTGFYNLGARYYEPTSGRFLSPDPMGHAASMSLYDYCDGDPVNRFDPDGRFGKDLSGNPYDTNIRVPVYPPGGDGDVYYRPASQAEAAYYRAMMQGTGDQVSQGINQWMTNQTDRAFDSANDAAMAQLAGQLLLFEGLGLLNPSAIITDSGSTVAAETGAADSSLLTKYLNGSGGRWGGTATRLQNDSLATSLEDAGYQVTGGAGRAAEEWIPGAAGGTTGGTFVDLTATDGASTVRVQTISTLSSGAPTATEAAAAARIQAAFPNDQLMLVPKWPK